MAKKSDVFMQRSDGNFEEINFELVPGARMDGQLLYTIDDKQLFRKKSKYRNKGYWYICRIKQCTARVFFDVSQGKCIRNITGNNWSHCHSEDQSSVCAELKLAHKIKTECTGSCSSDSGIRRISEIFDQNVRTESDTTLNFNKMARNLYRLRSIFMPQSPKTASDVALCFQDEKIMQNFGTSLFDDGSALPFYRFVFKSDAFSYCIFASQSIIGNIEAHVDLENRHYLLDATFKVVPCCEFSQLLIIHVYHLEQTTPFIFVLSNRKTESCYKHIFQHIDKKVFCLRGKAFTTDYEQAMRSALRTVYPRVEFINCWFHYCQALRRHLNTIPGFVVAIRNDVGAMEIYAKFNSLPLLPHNLINEAFKELRNEAESYNKDLFHRFLKYFEILWIKKEGPRAISVFEKDLRTTNALEEYNEVICKKFPGKGHFFRFCLDLLKEEYIKAREFSTLIRTGSPSSSVSGKTKYSNLNDRNDRIMKATCLLKKNKLTTREFLSRVCCKSNKLEANIDRFDYVNENQDEMVLTGEDNKIEPIDATAQDDEAKPKINCVRCHTKPFEMFMKCGHVCLCEDCLDELKDSTKASNELIRCELTVDCPMCFQPCPFKDIMKCIFPT